MKVLLTGGGGFIGSHIVLGSRNEDFEFILPVRSRSRLQGLPKNVALFECDIIREMDRFVDLIRSEKPEICIHLAWDGIHRGQRNHAGQVHNVVLNEKILRACAEAGCRRYIGLGSQAEYGVHNKRIDENVSARPESLYGAYKLAAAHSTGLIASELGLEFAWLRLFSTYGPGDNDSYIIPYVITSLIKGQSPELTDCTQLWDYLYVKDVARLIELVARSTDSVQGVYNLSSGAPVRLKDLILRIQEKFTVPIQIGKLPSRPDGQVHLEGDNSKFKNDFGWIELTGHDQAIAETIDFFQKQSLSD